MTLTINFSEEPYYRLQKRDGSLSYRANKSRPFVVTDPTTQKIKKYMPLHFKAVADNQAVKQRRVGSYVGSGYVTMNGECIKVRVGVLKRFLRSELRIFAYSQKKNLPDLDRITRQMAQSTINKKGDVKEGLRELCKHYKLM